jgi:hypothetical protein
MEAREALAQLIVHKVEEAEEGSRDLDFASDALEQHVAALEELVSEHLPAWLHEQGRKGEQLIVSELQRAQLAAQLQVTLHNTIPESVSPTLIIDHSSPHTTTPPRLDQTARHDAGARFFDWAVVFLAASFARVPAAGPNSPC